MVCSVVNCPLFVIQSQQYQRMFKQNQHNKSVGNEVIKQVCQTVRMWFLQPKTLMAAKFSIPQSAHIWEL